LTVAVSEIDWPNVAVGVALVTMVGAASATVNVSDGTLQALAALA
jgi:hypothetical protein